MFCSPCCASGRDLYDRILPFRKQNRSFMCNFTSASVLVLLGAEFILALPKIGEPFGTKPESPMVLSPKMSGYSPTSLHRSETLFTSCLKASHDFLISRVYLRRVEPTSEQLCRALLYSSDGSMNIELYLAASSLTRPATPWQVWHESETWAVA